MGGGIRCLADQARGVASVAPGKNHSKSDVFFTVEKPRLEKGIKETRVAKIDKYMMNEKLEWRPKIFFSSGASVGLPEVRSIPYSALRGGAELILILTPFFVARTRTAFPGAEQSASSGEESYE